MHATMNKIQIRDKEKELKGDYKILKKARMESGASWNEQTCMIEAEPHTWNNIIAVRSLFPTFCFYITHPFDKLMFYVLLIV